MRSHLVVLALLGVVACGGASTAPTSSPSASPGADAGAESFAEIHPADLAELAGAADAGGAPDGTSSALVESAGGEPIDECTPASVDFEKRARPKIKECYREGKKKTPDLKGTIRIAVDIDTLGKIRGTKVTEKTLPEPVARCMLAAVKGTPFPDANKCPGKTLTLPVSFPTP